jgi:hypothetical protein
MFHLLRPVLDEALKNITAVLCDDGVLAFDLGPSNYAFDLPLEDHRLAAPQPGTVMTELAHPLYRRVHDLVYKAVKAKYPNFDRENLWPSPAMRYTKTELGEILERHGLELLHIKEIISPVAGCRVKEFIRNGWTVFFRWPPLDALPMDEKLAMMKSALSAVLKKEDLESVMAYHPTAVAVAQRQKEAAKY